jgi:hypothetical protein
MQRSFQLVLSIVIYVATSSLDIPLHVVFLIGHVVRRHKQEEDPLPGASALEAVARVFPGSG